MSDINTFKENLESDKYSDITAARRAIGKFRDMSDEDRAKMHNLANKYFDAEPAKAKGAKSAPAKKTPAAEAAPAAKRAAKPAVEKAPVTKTPAPAAAKKAPGKRGSVKDAESSVDDADRTLTTISHATTELLRIGEKGIDVTGELQKAQRGISAVLDSLVGTADGIAPVASPVSAPATVAPAVTGSMPVMPGLGAG